MIVFPNAKINLGLYVTGKRPDGYHDIRTILYPIALCDILEIVAGKGKTILHHTGETIPGDKKDNIVWRAYELLGKKHSLPALDIHLHKVVPTGAGLGGGSSDGAYTLCLLNKMFGLGIATPELLRLAGELGSDCPFFIRNVPSIAAGRGEMLTGTPLSLRGYYGLVYMPRTRVSTSDAYSMVKPVLSPKEYFHLEKRNIEGWKDWLSNSFEESIFRIHPEIAEVKSGLYDSGAVYASMTGSGSAVFGIFRKEPSVKPVFPDVRLIWQGLFD